MCDTPQTTKPQRCKVKSQTIQRRPYGISRDSSVGCSSFMNRFRSRVASSARHTYTALRPPRSSVTHARTKMPRGNRASKDRIVASSRAPSVYVCTCLVCAVYVLRRKRCRGGGISHSSSRCTKPKAPPRPTAVVLCIRTNRPLHRANSRNPCPLSHCKRTCRALGLHTPSNMRTRLHHQPRRACSDVHRPRAPVPLPAYSRRLPPSSS
jgi:hypothetical protein